MAKRSQWGRGGAAAPLVGLFALLSMGCEFAAIKACHEQMGTSQKAMLEMKPEDAAEVAAALVLVSQTRAVCAKAGRSDEVAKITSAEQQLTAQVKALKERAARKVRPKLSESQLLTLEKSGDLSCPRGQQYEHHQNQKLINCTGPQLVEMNEKQLREYFERRGFTESQKPHGLGFELGAQVYEFRWTAEERSRAPTCVTIVASPGMPWQETVSRASGVHPRYLSLGKAVKTKAGPVPLLIEGDSGQFTVKWGACSPTPGQKPYEEPKAPADQP